MVRPLIRTLAWLLALLLLLVAAASAWRRPAAGGDCPPCLFSAPGVRPAPGEAHLHMTTTLGFGRTGNNVRQLQGALVVGHLCGRLVTLPASDERNEALRPDPQHLVFDFRGLQPRAQNDAHPLCLDISAAVVGDASVFWTLHKRLRPFWAAQSPHGAAVRASASAANACLRHYLGVCSPSYCAGAPTAAPHALTIHLRHGDIFNAAHFDLSRPDTNAQFAKVLSKMGQPPLAFYLAVLQQDGGVAGGPGGGSTATSAHKWASMHVVAEPVPPALRSPVWDALALLAAAGTAPGPGPVSPGAVANTSRSASSGGYLRKAPSPGWAHDLRLLMCATNLVLAQSSTLRGLLALGRAGREGTLFACAPCGKAAPALLQGLQPRRLVAAPPAAGYRPLQSGGWNASRPELRLEMLTAPMGEPPLCPPLEAGGGGGG